MTVEDDRDNSPLEFQVFWCNSSSTTLSRLFLIPRSESKRRTLTMTTSSTELPGSLVSQACQLVTRRGLVADAT
jgi:hypothetical protein